MNIENENKPILSVNNIEVIYDQSFTERLKISYYTKTYNNRLRVYKKVEKCNAMNCATSSLQTVIAESPIADYVDDLQFSGSKNGNTLGTGTVAYGQGNMRAIVPVNVTTNCSNNNGDNKSIDGSTTISTFYQCSDNTNFTYLKFNYW